MAEVRAPEHANRRLSIRLLAVAVAMFGFGYALVPLYNVFCELTGIRFTDRQAAERPAAAVDTTRWVTVELTGTVMRGLPWDFRPLEHRLRVRPGEPTVARFTARNRVGEPIVGQAVPSVTPPRATRHFKKTECFCFTRQSLGPGETKEMTVRFVIDPKLPADVGTITLSYAFFNADRSSARRYDGPVPSAAVHAAGPRSAPVSIH